MYIRLQKVKINFILSLLLLVGSHSFAQKHTIAVFCPIYLDEAFDGYNFKIWDNKIPKSMQPGLEFYNGVITAIDSLKKANKNLFIKIYDYKSNGNSIDTILVKDSNLLNNAKAIIAVVNNKQDIKLLADFANQKNIPVISATYPNDAGVENNPKFFLLNPTLKTHCKALYKYMCKQKPTANVYFAKRAGKFEDMVAGYIKEFDEVNLSTPLNIPIANLTDSFSYDDFVKMLDSNKQNIIFCASVNDIFISQLVHATAAAKKYHISVLGMPTWNDIKQLNKDEYASVNIEYTSSCNYDGNGSLLNSVTTKYKTKFANVPSEMFFKGFEAMLRFGKLISMYGDNAIQLFSDDMFVVINPIDLQPVYNTKNPSQIDYYENKKIYLVKKNGKVVKYDE